MLLWVTRRSVSLLGGFLIVALSGIPALAHGGGIDAVVEVASRDAGFEYGLALTWSDGDPLTGAHIVMRADQDDLVEIAEPVEVTPGVYVGSLPIVSVGEWQVAVAIHHPDSNGSISFVHNVTSPDAWSWVVLVDTANENRVGSTPDPATSILEPPVVSTTTTLPVSDAEQDIADTPPATTAQSSSSESDSVGEGDVVVDIESEGTAAMIDIGMRIAHLVAIGLWIVPVFASLFGKQSRVSVVSGVAGVLLTMATGTVLMLWGTPVSFPGLFSWGEIADLSYGPSYLLAFVVKMVGVLLAAAATLRWALRVDRTAAWVTLTGGALAVIAVTAMNQYHLLSHF